MIKSSKETHLKKIIILFVDIKDKPYRIMKGVGRFFKMQWEVTLDLSKSADI
jgi:hypothetical protein